MWSTLGKGAAAAVSTTVFTANAYNQLPQNSPARKMLNQHVMRPLATKTEAPAVIGSLMTIGTVGGKDYQHDCPNRKQLNEYVENNKEHIELADYQSIKNVNNGLDDSGVELEEVMLKTIINSLEEKMKVKPSDPEYAEVRKRVEEQIAQGFREGGCYTGFAAHKINKHATPVYQSLHNTTTEIAKKFDSKKH